MAAGFKFYMLVNSAECSFKEIDVDESFGTIDASARLRPDFLGVNLGYSARLDDLATLTIDINSLMSPGGSLFLLTRGVNNVAWTIGYDSIPIYTGASLYVENYNYSARIPGEGRVRLRAYANGAYTKLI